MKLSKSILYSFNLTEAANNTKSLKQVLKASEQPISIKMDEYYNIKFERPIVRSIGPGARSATTIGSLPDEIHEYIVNDISSRLDSSISKYRPFFIIQIAKGNIKLYDLNEDFTKYIEAVKQFAALSKKSYWTQSTNIYEFDSIQDLSKIVMQFLSRAREEDKQKSTKDSIILFEKAYKINNSNKIKVAQLLGMQPPEPEEVIKEYWLRRVLTMNGCIKYGKGTQWCTASSHNLNNLDATGHVSDDYLLHGIFQIERRVTNTIGDSTTRNSREPILQFTPGSEMKNINDEENRPKSTLKMFMLDCAQALKDLPAPTEKITYEVRPGKHIIVDEPELWKLLMYVLKNPTDYDK